MYKRVIFGEIINQQVASLRDLNLREITVLTSLALGIIWMGVYPASFTDILNVTVDGLLSHVAISKL